MKPRDERLQSERKKLLKIKARTFADVVAAFLASDKFANLAAETQYGYRQYLRAAQDPEVLGALPVGIIRPALVQRFLDSLADRPGAQQRAKVALSSLESWAVVRDLLPFPITTGTELVDHEDGGHEPWTEAQMETGEHYAAAFMSRVLTLAGNTGQRGSDLVKMRWTDIEKVDGHPGINVVQQKTGMKLWVPFTAALQDKIETWERQPGFILRKPTGEPWENRKNMYTSWTRERDKNPNLKACAGLVLHGLRATAVVRLRRLGCPPTLIADMVGMSVAMIERYCRLSNQKTNALAAVHYLNRTASERAGLSQSGSPAKTRS